MPTFALRLMAPRPNFAQTLTDDERAIMSRHAAHWRPYLDRGDMVVFGPVLTDDGSYGLPVVTTGTAAFEFGRLAAGHVRSQ
jgi:hypothetical protein